MKKIIQAITFGCLLSACSTMEYVQIVDIQSNNLTEKENNYIYEDDNCKILYNFWGSHGKPGFVIENKTDEMLYVNLANTFFNRNGMAYDYFLNRSYSIGKSAISTSGKSASANVFGIWALSNLPGSKSFIQTEGASIGSTSNLTYEEKEISVVPPHSRKYFDEYEIWDDVIQDCSIKLFPKRKQKESMSFTKDNSPLKFGNYITYKIGENGNNYHITNDFYVSGFTNYKLDEVKENVKIGCQEQNTISINKYQKGTSYFIHYTNKHNNDYSADAKGFPNSSGQFYDILY
jgi:hypothetical protein